jgi:hypothetical protein
MNVGQRKRRNVERGSGKRLRNLCVGCMKMFVMNFLL